MEHAYTVVGVDAVGGKTEIAKTSSWMMANNIASFALMSTKYTEVQLFDILDGTQVANGERSDK